MRGITSGRAMAALVLAGALAGATTSSAAASAPKQSCSLAPEEAAFIFPRGVIYEQGNEEERKVFAACWRPTGRTRVIFSTPVTSAPPTYLSAAKTTGSWVVLKRTSPSGNASPSTDMLLSFNVQTGRRGPRVLSTSPNAIGPLPDTNGERGLLSPIVIADNGDYAWVMSSFPLPKSQALGDALYTPDGHGGDRLLDEGARGTITRLHVAGQTLHWLHDGHSKTSKLP
jgi:hypothetical protein